MARSDQDETPLFEARSFACLYSDCGAYAHQVWQILAVAGNFESKAYRDQVFKGLFQAAGDHYIGAMAALTTNTGSRVG